MIQIIMCNFVVHSNVILYRKIWRIGMDPVKMPNDERTKGICWNCNISEGVIWNVPLSCVYWWREWRSVQFVWRLVSSIGFFVFIYNIKKQKSTIGEVRVLKEILELVCHKWPTIGLSFTPKVHLFIDHVMDQIQEIKYNNTMGKDHIERAHQRRNWIAYRGLTNRNKMGNMKIQAKDERIRYTEIITEFF